VPQAHVTFFVRARSLRESPARSLREVHVTFFVRAFLAGEPGLAVGSGWDNLWFLLLERQVWQGRVL
jgi:hypothetical protein